MEIFDNIRWHWRKHNHEKKGNASKRRLINGDDVEDLMVNSNLPARDQGLEAAVGELAIASFQSERLKQKIIIEKFSNCYFPFLTEDYREKEDTSGRSRLSSYSFNYAGKTFKLSLEIKEINNREEQSLPNKTSANSHYAVDTDGDYGDDNDDDDDSDIN